MKITRKRREEKRTQNVVRETEIEGRTRSLWPSSIRIPRISVNGPLLPRPFGQCTVWVVDMSPQIPHILRRMGRWRCRAQPTGIRLVTATRYGPRRSAFLSLSSLLALSPRPFLCSSFSLRDRGKLHPSDEYNANGRGLSTNSSMHLSIRIYLFAQENNVPILLDKCSSMWVAKRIERNKTE